MPRKRFAELEQKMSPDRRARVQARTRQLLDQTPRVSGWRSGLGPIQAASIIRRALIARGDVSEGATTEEVCRALAEPGADAFCAEAIAATTQRLKERSCG